MVIIKRQKESSIDEGSKKKASHYIKLVEFYLRELIEGKSYEGSSKIKNRTIQLPSSPSTDYIFKRGEISVKKHVHCHGYCTSIHSSRNLDFT